jgi:hypothetical protein
MTMVIQYRFIKGKWQTFARRYEPFMMLDLRGEQYWFVPGTVDDF